MKDVQWTDDLLAALLKRGADDARALCFASVISHEQDDLRSLRRAADLGYPLAMSLLSPKIRGEEGLKKKLFFFH
jgi:hypothetical protein